MKGTLEKIEKTQLSLGLISILLFLYKLSSVKMIKVEILSGTVS